MTKSVVPPSVTPKGPGPAFTTRPEILGTFGVVTTTHWLASAAGMGMLERGGNAFDAAVCAGFTLNVAEPHLNGPLGDAPIITHEAATRETKMICGQGPAPMGATIEHYRSLGLDLVPGAGFLAAVVPAAPDAWLTLLEQKGTMRLRDVLEPAIHYAETGVPLVPNVIKTIETVEDLFREEWPTSAELWLPGGNLPKAFALHCNPKLAETWKRLLKESEGGSREQEIRRARTCFYEGFIAEAVVAFNRNELMDSSGERHAGVLAMEDFTSYRLPIEDPLTHDYRDHTVVKGGPWCQGPALLQQLAILEGYDIASLDPTGPDYVHYVVEAAKLAFADRDTFYGDPDHVEVPLDVLLSKAYNDGRRAQIGEMASLDLRPGNIPGFGTPPDYAAACERAFAEAAPGTGEPTTGKLGTTKGDTVHIDVIDRWGNMVSATPSASWLHSSPTIPELGMCLGSRAQMFWLDENHPSALKPGKRPRTTLTPSMLLRDGEAVMSFGTPGGDQQDQWQVGLLLHHLDHGMNLQEAIDCPNFHSEHFISSFHPRAAHPGKLVLEGRFPDATIKELERRGHVVEVGGDWSEGRLTAARRDGKMLKAAANPRGMQGYAVGR
ncbi:MAG: gamma-glutamyltransferase family protein [Rhodospirillales bacterium]